MRIRALSTFTHPSEDGMIVLNAAKGKAKAGEADLPDDVAQGYIDAGMAEKAKTGKDALGHDDNGKRDDAAAAAAAPKAVDAGKAADAAKAIAPAAGDKAP